MKCWKCGNDVTKGSSKCISCGADQNRSIPTTDIGKAMRQLYDRYGKDTVLQKSEYLDKGLGDILAGKGDAQEDTMKIRRRIRMAMETGLGNLYLDQLNGSGVPDRSFKLRVKALMAEDAGLSGEASEEIAGYFDEMIGWETESGVEIPRPHPTPTPKPTPNHVPASPAQQPTPAPESVTKSRNKRAIVFIVLGIVVAWLLGIIIGKVLNNPSHIASESEQVQDGTLTPIFVTTPAIKATPTLEPTITPPITPTPAPRTEMRDASVGDIIAFGTYEQDNDISNGKEDIEWLVIAKERNKILVISHYALDCLPYNTEYEEVTWKTCTLRRWLNETFLDSAFSSKERDSIINSTISADKNPLYSSSPGNNTKDKVFLLSIKEVNKYFDSDKERQCRATAFCFAQGVLEDDDCNCWWWLRTPGEGPDTDFATGVYYEGGVDYVGDEVAFTGGGVRPALWINLGF